MIILKKRDTSIAICRVLATFMIVICHLGSAYNNSAVGQFFQSGVQLFILISGLLYGNKEIDNFKTWWINRWKRICIPCYIFSVIIFSICLFIEKSCSVVGLFEIFLNVEGFHHIITFVSNPWVGPGVSHFWFITIILMCYMIVTLMKKFELDEFFHRNDKLIISVLFFLSILTGLCGIRLDFFVIFLLGYASSKQKNNFISKRRLIASVGLFIFAIILRVLGKIYCDSHGDNNLYLYVLIPTAYNMIAFSLYCWIRKANEMLGQNVFFGGRVLFWFDALSFYIFITHYMLIDGPISLAHITDITILNITFIIVGTLISSLLLSRLSRLITNLI